MEGSQPPDGESRQGRGAKTPKERADERRREKLDHIKDQVDSGELTIRQMTPEERSEHPPRPAKPRRERR